MTFRDLRTGLAAIVLVAGATRAQTSLAAGDVALVGIHCDDLSGSGGGAKALAFVSFVPMEAGTVVGFTDKGWQSPDESFRTGEGVISHTVGPGGLQPGTVVTLAGTSGSFDLSTSGDQIFAFQGTIDGTTGVFTGVFVWGLNNEGAGVWQSTATTANDSALPPALASYNVALAEMDNYVYNGPLSGTAAQLRAAIMNPANWVGSNTTQPVFPTAFEVVVPTIFEDGFESGDASAWSFRSP